MKKTGTTFNYTIGKIGFFCLFFFGVSGSAQITVNSLAQFRVAVQNSNQMIILQAGEYQLNDLPSGSRVINCTGSGNTIDLTGVRIKTLVGSIREVYFIISGDSNVLKNGAIEDYYQSGLGEVTDFSAYNHDRNNLAYGLKGDPVMSITGNGNLVDGLEMTIKGSFPYGYGSQYGIGSTNTFGLSKRCGILITGKAGGGVGNTLDHITMYHHAFGHGIFMQNNATETTIKNSYIEGRMRLSDDMYNDTETYDLPYITGYRFPSGDNWRDIPFAESYPIPYDVMYPLSEDGIRSYNGSGSVLVENCIVKQMRGGIRLYLASSATVTNTKAIDCGATNFNMPNNGTITGSSGNFSYAPLSDFRLSRSRQNIEMTILPSPNAVGPHNLADILGNDHHIIFHRADGPLDTEETRVIVVSGDNSTIVNETEYAIVLEASASGNTISSCGPVTDNGSNNTILDCDAKPNVCGDYDAFTVIQAADFCSQSGIQKVGVNNVGYVNAGDWVKYENVDFGGGVNSIEISASSGKTGGTIEIRTESRTGTLIGTVNVPGTGSFTSWRTFKTSVSVTAGKQDVYLIFTGGSGYLLDVDWLQFSSSNLSVWKADLEESNTSFLYPNPVSASTTIQSSKDSILKIYDLQGNKIFTEAISTNNERVDLSSLQTGIYFAEVHSDTARKVIKLVKE
ncbi:carbohydrate-binding protein [Flavicella sediminum]|uniref:carbohydrate-binding protein n=1 Tax=Flavicella sediminum TaxID=2585141 RepID=UPI00111E13E7|nr:carbohydrate-binding protein [Flavicella sediminum]